ncbi:MAG: hypothetical protein CMI54_02410 [Parcubacteria group bacterium]|jgi:hypothetical protein|nr:hypothetical protein [Parcubacteria group bacterium]
MRAKYNQKYVDHCNDAIPYAVAFANKHYNRRTLEWSQAFNLEMNRICTFYGRVKVNPIQDPDAPSRWE